MRQYVVQSGDTPARIASRDDMAGCPKCAIDLVRANPHKAAVVMPNGFVTFRDMRVGEKLNLPDKWFDGSLDTRPKAYFSALPYPDGVTPSTLGDAAAGVLSDFAALDAAAASLADLSTMTDKEFSGAADSTAALISSAVREVVGSSNATAAGYAQDTQAGAYWAGKRTIEMAAAVEAGDMAAAASTRPEIQNVLNTAMGSARLALQSFYGAAPSPPASTGGQFPASVVAAAQAASAAIASDLNYCASVARPGTPVNSAVHAFKVTYNAAALTSGWTPVPINTGNYEAATANVLANVLGGSAPSACGARGTPAPPPTPPVPTKVAVAAPQKQGPSFGTVLGIGLLAAGALGTVFYFSTPAAKEFLRS